jgi:RES domain-containing protein
MRLYRICRATAKGLDGEGPCMHGARWNSPGISAVYASESVALAAIEELVELDTDDVPDDLVVITLEVPDSLSIDEIDPATLPEGWRDDTEYTSTRPRGDRWFHERKTPLLRVPAAPVPGEWNYVINPDHPDAELVSVAKEEPFRYDPRLL